MAPLAASGLAAFRRIKGVLESAASGGAKETRAEGKPALLLAEEKILVPDTDKDIKCLCPRGGPLHSHCNEYQWRRTGAAAAAAVPSGPRFLRRSAAAWKCAA